MRNKSKPKYGQRYGGKERIYVQKTKERKTEYAIAVDIEQLSAMLGCGKTTAKQLGELAGARIVIGRRVLYSVRKVEQYVESIAL